MSHETRGSDFKRCIRGAWEIEELQLFGGPKWLDQDRFDIDAKASTPVGDRQLMLMLQSLLAERAGICGFIHLCRDIQRSDSAGNFGNAACGSR